MSFREAVLMGLAEDGGLLVPESLPKAALDRWAGLDYPTLAHELFTLFGADVPLSLFERTYGPAYGGEVAHLRKVGDRFLLELFHGPTLAFKDVALQLLGNLFEHYGRELNVVAATSGDTGSAAIYGLRGRKNLRIFVMHPKGRVSPLQERQMTTVLDDNVFNLAVRGSFDDCQGLLKGLFRDLDFKREHRLGAVNSVNWCRVLAQMVYYFSAGLQQIRHGRPLHFAVPTGNFGNFLSAWYAARMGLPIETLILATNENDILTRYFRTGSYRRGDVHFTLAPAMDIQVASNFERFLAAQFPDPASLAVAMQTFDATGALEHASESPIGPRILAGSANRAQILEAIRSCEAVLDPHTAVAWHVVGEVAPELRDVVVVATAHPAKFPEAVFEATARKVTHPRLEALWDMPTRLHEIGAELSELKDFVHRSVRELV